MSRAPSVYIHVPFCKKKCDYCSFYSIANWESCLIDRWLEVILSEIDRANDYFLSPYSTIYIGGGNPGILGPERIKTIAEKLTENGIAEEFTVECNPEDLTMEFESLKPMVTRISVGIQSMNDKSLKTLGRNSSTDSNRRAMSVLSSLPFDFNCDIITAIPHETIEESILDISEVASYNPSHISLYSLSVEEGTELFKREEERNDADEFLIAGWEKLRSLGYEHYEVSNFALPGKRCKHNLAYWKLDDYLGLGPCAESSFGYKRAVSVRQNENLADFLTKPRFNSEYLTESETEEEYIMLSLRTSDGINKAEYRGRFGYDFDSRFSERILALNKSWYRDYEYVFSLTEEGFLFLDTIILELSLAID